MRQLSKAQREQFGREGYLVVEDVLDPERDIAPVLAEYEQILDEIATALYEDGAIASTYCRLSFTDRLIQICAESGRTFAQHFDISLPKGQIRRDTPLHVGPAAFGILTNPRLLDVVEDIVGPEVYSNPVQHIRMKLPKRALREQTYDSLVVKTSWHQDNGVILPEADESTILTVWLPLNDATLANGCLTVVPRSHRQGLVTHCPSAVGTWIPDRLVPTEQAVPMPMRAGSVLLMHQRTIHASLDNATDSEVRLSLDLRYQPVGQASGRPMFPGFVARSATRPETVLRDSVTWAQRWYDTRDQLADHEDVSFKRWSSDAPVCA